MSRANRGQSAPARGTRRRLWNSPIGSQDEVVDQAIRVLLAYHARGLFYVLQRVSSMSEIWKNSDGTRVSNEPHHQVLAIPRLGHGYDRQDQPSIKQRPHVDFGHYGLFH